MRAGKLDMRVAFQRKAQSSSSSGEPVETWSTLATRWADVEPLFGTEVNAAEQWIAREQSRFTVRWSSDIDDLSPLDRVIFPASDAQASPVPSRSVYDVIAVQLLGRNEGIAVQAARRVG